MVGGSELIMSGKLAGGPPHALLPKKLLVDLCELSFLGAKH